MGRRKRPQQRPLVAVEARLPPFALVKANKRPLVAIRDGVGLVPYHSVEEERIAWRQLVQVLMLCFRVPHRELAARVWRV